MSSSKQTQVAISERAQYLLKILIERYIRDGQPVGSKILAAETGLNLSPATIRNILADLEEHGYLCSPHTSAGRVPTALGYRFFVDSLLIVKLKSIDTVIVNQLRDRFSNLRGDASVATLVGSASRIVSDLTRLAGLVMLPRRKRICFRYIEFLPLSDNRLLAILVLNEHEVQNRIIQTDRRYSLEELQRAANFLNKTYCGQDIIKLRKKLLTAIQRDHAYMDHIVQTALEVATKAIVQMPKNDQDYVVAGQGRLLEWVDATGIERLQQLFEAFNQKKDILHLLDQCLAAEGVQIFIGQESGYNVLDECSLVTAPYLAEGQPVGVVGVIGPTRMPYEHVISVVDVTAKLLSVALNQVH